MADEFEVLGTNDAAPFRLRIHRGEGMALLGMDWRTGRPPSDFVGFAIEYLPPGAAKFLALRNRLTFMTPPKNVGASPTSTLVAPIQMFRWVHFPFDAEKRGEYRYRVRPAFMDAARNITLGDAQEAGIELRRETYPGLLNISFTRGFVSSQAFVDRYGSARTPISTLLPSVAKTGLSFVPTHPKTKTALAWMGFEARSAILEVLDQAIADPTAQVRVVAFDLNEPEIVRRLEQLGARLRIVVDDSKDHRAADDAESLAAERLRTSAGVTNVKRQHMDNLQHNKTVVVQGDAGHVVVCGSTNFSWRGFYVQANNALVLRGEHAATVFRTAFDAYWGHDSVDGFGTTISTRWRDLGLAGLDARVSFSPHGAASARLGSVAADIGRATSSVFYSLAFLAQTGGAVRDAIAAVTANPKIFVYGMADKKIGGLDLQTPDGNIAPVMPAALTTNVPEPFKYLENGENLIRIRDRRVAVSYTVEALRLFDHYRFRVKQLEATANHEPLNLREPPADGADPWWLRDYTVPIRIRDRKLFS